MNDTARAELTARIAANEKNATLWSQGLDGPPDKQLVARRGIAADLADIALCRLLLGDVEAAKDGFARAAEMAHSSLPFVPPPQPLTYTPSISTYEGVLELAVLSGHRDLAARYASEPVDPGPRPSAVGDRLQWGLALPALVTGDDAHVLACAKEAAAVPEGKAWYPGLGDAMAALAHGDAGALSSSLARVLAKHARYAKAKTSPVFNRGFVCHPATVLVALARRRSIEVGDLPGRRATVPLALMYSTEARPVQPVKLDVDLVPDALTSP